MGNILKLKTIMVVEDDINIANLLARVLSKEQANVIVCFSGKEALNKLKKIKPHLILLDIKLPDITGFELCKRVTNVYNTAIIMITAKNHIEDKIKGLELGADDYITKPFHIAEVLLRIKKIISRLYNDNIDNKVINLNPNIEVFKDSYKIAIDKNEVKLNPKEFELLMLFINNANKVLKRDFILDNIWGNDFFGDIRTVDVNIQRLRKKLKSTKHNPIIETVFGVGYVLKKSVLSDN
ncbi:response regulator transcription factor [Clostridium sp. 'deep sea']|uniref:response regulator transcription factor n=1 Tax=Clostridium sp. 'deep sea' TaxID=2779445 RepID=UPI0018968BD4|nr:response regulator transcription factor [Clostridium sp. 'deep sea']QOR35261.1 response regulator transcription factor [Clostridium sp. 'deep sea']